jgi:exopolysaccharide biosynthesis polyprenyl glycosylphosphotransferase
MREILHKVSPVYKLAQLSVDVLILLSITRIMRDGFSHPGFERLLETYGAFLLILSFPLFDLYRSWRGSSIFAQLQRLFLSWAFVLLLFNIIIVFLSTAQQRELLWPFGLFRNREFLLWGVCVFTGLAFLRVVVKLSLKILRKKGMNLRGAVIVGAGKAGVKMAHYIKRNPWMGIEIIGFFDDSYSEGEAILSDNHVLGRVIGPVKNCIKFSMSSIKPDMVFVALPMRAEEKISNLVWSLGTKGIKVFLVPDLFTLGIQRSKVNDFGDFHLIDFNLFPVWKRTFDVIFSSFAILMTLPLWCVIILLIKLEDGGPIFFRHRRIMEDGRSFDCLKFRTMRIDAEKRLEDLLSGNPGLKEEWERTYKLKKDPRITRIGKVLRKTSLDELPQFINVMYGQMSVVGARPIVQKELEDYYGKTALTYCSTKPGITGPWQVGERSDIDDYDERVRLDQYYVLNCSFWFDVKIIFLTICSMFRGKGAY